MNEQQKIPKSATLAHARRYLAVAAFRSHLDLVLISLLACLAILYFAWPVWRAQWALEIDGNEAWNAFHVARLQAELPLYPPSDALIANNYPPISFVLVRWLSDFGASPIFVGRLLSLFGTVASALGLAWIIRLLGCGWSAIAVGSFWYLATMSRFFDVYVGMNDPNLVALAAMIFGLAWVLWAQQNSKPIEPAFILMGIAGFYKHTLFACPITSLMWLFIYHPRAAIRGAATGAGVVFLGIAVCIDLYGQVFIAQMTAPRVIDLHRLVSGFGRLQFIAPALFIWGFWMWTGCKTRAGLFAAMFVGMGFADHFLQQIGEGVDDNSEFELIAALAVGVALAFENVATWVGVQRGRILILLVLTTRLLLSNRVEPYLLLWSDEFRQIGKSSTKFASMEAKRIAAISGEVSCSIMSVCYYAGKRFVFDGFSIKQRLKLGLMTVDQLQASLSREGIVFQEIDPRSNMSEFRRAANLYRQNPKQP